MPAPFLFQTQERGVCVFGRSIFLPTPLKQHQVRLPRGEPRRGSGSGEESLLQRLYRSVAGYDTVIGEGGVSLFRGEKQRISIARVMLKDAPIVIPNEVTANVDPENEGRLQKAVEALIRDKTILMIAYRLRTVRNVDQILVLDDGKIVQKGWREELIGQPGIYADFVGGKKETDGWKL